LAGQLLPHSDIDVIVWANRKNELMPVDLSLALLRLYFVFESPSELETIGIRAFSGCAMLQSLSLPASLMVIPAHAVCDMTSLMSLIFEPGCRLSEMGGYLFSGRSALVLIWVRKFVEVIVFGCFADLDQLKSLTFGPGSTLREIKAQYCEIAIPARRLFSINTICTNGYILYVSELSVTIEPYFKLSESIFLCIPDSYAVVNALNPHVIPLEFVAPDPFHHSELLTFEFGSRLTEIAQAICIDRSLLDLPWIPPTVRAIGSGGFRECRSLKMVTFGFRSQLT
jgi:hypothetical protein